MPSGQVRELGRPSSAQLGSEACVISMSPRAAPPAWGGAGATDSWAPALSAGGHPAVCAHVCTRSLPQSLTIHLIWGQSKQRRRVCAQPGGARSLSSRGTEAGLRIPLGAVGGGREGNRELEALPVRRPQTRTNTGGGDMGEEARLTKKQIPSRSEVGPVGARGQTSTQSPTDREQSGIQVPQRDVIQAKWEL